MCFQEFFDKARDRLVMTHQQVTALGQFHQACFRYAAGGQMPVRNRHQRIVRSVDYHTGRCDLVEW